MPPILPQRYWLSKPHALIGTVSITVVRIQKRAVAKEAFTPESRRNSAIYNNWWCLVTMVLDSDYDTEF
ncbi:hypothetical protein DPMN_074962 [Dreissena polymorpha]|uniref:Uncharacterized protein n=1 Tax=Dreissena polymorpha TaxID=45954 RepID=A0A9D3YJL6_DREPO|nr:hypothetical protein DPMN_074962 [Dreissena polymorpha]